MTQQEVIKKFMESLDNTNLSGVEALDEAVQSCSNFSSIQAVINQMISDCQNASSADDFLKNYCAIDLDNTDTGAITGKDAGGNSTKTAESVVPEYGSLQTYTNNSFTTNGVTFRLSSDFNLLTTSQKYIWQGLYTWWAESSLDLIEESYGSNYKLNSGTNLDVSFTYDTNFLASAPYTYYYNGYCEPVGLKISSIYYGNMDPYDENGSDKISGQNYLDRTLAHEFTHAVMADKIKYFFRLPQFITEGMAELTHGIDDTRTSVIINLANDPSSLKSALNLSDTNTGSVNSYAGGFMFLRYFAKQVSEPTDSVFTNDDDFYSNNTADTVLSALEGNDTILNYAGNVTIHGDADKDYFANYGDYVTIDGGAGNDTLRNWNNYVMLSGDVGNDFIYSYGDNITINGGSGNDKILNAGQNSEIYGGLGNDRITLSASATNNLIYYADGDGNDTIFGITANDTLNISDLSYSTVKSGKNLVVKVGSNKIVLKNSANENISIVGNYVETLPTGLNYNSARTALTLGSSYENSYIDLSKYADVKILNATKLNKALVISGNSLANTIKAGSGNDVIHGNAGNDYISGGKGNDVISGGNGNDTLKGGNGRDIFMYSSGNDVIIDYTAKDSIIITGSYTKKVSGNNVIFKMSSGTLTVKNGKNKKITVNGISENYNINEMWFAEEDNFAVADDLNKITDEKISVVDNEQNNFISLTANNSVISAEGVGKY